MGAPTNLDIRQRQQQWIADTIQTTKEQRIDRGELGRELLLSIAGEIGYFKVIALLLAFLTLTVCGAVFGAIKLFRKGTR